MDVPEGDGLWGETGRREWEGTEEHSESPDLKARVFLHDTSSLTCV